MFRIFKTKRIFSQNEAYTKIQKHENRCQCVAIKSI